MLVFLLLHMVCFKVPPLTGFYLYIIYQYNNDITKYAYLNQKIFEYDTVVTQKGLLFKIMN